MEDFVALYARARLGVRFGRVNEVLGTMEFQKKKKQDGLNTFLK